MTTMRHTLLAGVLDPGLGGGGGGGESSAADVGAGLPSIEILKERKNETDKIFQNHSYSPGAGGRTPHIKGVGMIVGKFELNL